MFRELLFLLRRRRSYTEGLCSCKGRGEGKKNNKEQRLQEGHDTNSTDLHLCLLREQRLWKSCVGSGLIRTMKESNLRPPEFWKQIPRYWHIFGFLEIFSYFGHCLNIIGSRWHWSRNSCSSRIGTLYLFYWAEWIFVGLLDALLTHKMGGILIFSFFFSSEYWKYPLGVYICILSTLTW